MDITNTEIKNAACMLIINPMTGQFLGVSRKNDHEDMNLVGGKEDEEDYILGPRRGMTSIEYAARRECFEETGIFVTDMIQVFCRMARTRMVTTFLALSWHGEIKSSEEGVVKWLDLDELYKGTYGPYNKLLIREVFRLMVNLDQITLKKMQSNLVLPIQNEIR